jgi:multidrug transporter EmrE-like cation transporter
MQMYLALAAKIPVFILIIFAAASVIVGDYFAKLWSIEQRPILWVVAVIGYFFSGFFYIPTLLREGLVVTSLLWSVLSIVGFLAIGLIVFKEMLTGAQVVGVVFGIVSLVILAVASH